MSEVINSNSTSRKGTKQGSSSNSKKSKYSKKNEAIVSKYLMDRNYYSSEPHNTVPSAMTSSSQTKNEMIMANNIGREISRTNSFSYSNVSCLNNNPTTIDYQFSRLLSFIQGVKTKEKSDLEKLLPPMLCHLFIEMTKGKDWKVASIFLRKYSQIIFPETRLNGHDSLTPNNHSSFSELIQILSNITKKQDIDSTPNIIEFRTSKYKASLSLPALALLKQFLAHHGHILILQLLQTRFDIEIESHKSEENNGFVASPLPTPLIKQESNGMDELIKLKEPLVNGFQQSPKVEVKVENNKLGRNYDKIYKDELEEIVSRFKDINLPINMHTLENVSNISSVSIDKDGCHIAGGFEESNITIWPVNQFNNSYHGIPQHELVHPWSNRITCEWNLDQTGTDVEGENKIEMEPNTTNLILRGHIKAVTGVLYSKYNPLLLSVSRDCTVRLWTNLNYRCASILKGHNHPIWCVAESSNGYNLATGSKDTTARLWATDREYPLQVYAGHKQDIDAIDFHPNGNYFATASDDLSIRLWCVTSSKLLRVFTNCKLPAKSIKFSPNGQYLAAAGYETKIRIFDLAAGQQLIEMKNSTPMENICWSSDSSTVAATSTNGLIRLFKVASSSDNTLNTRSYITNCTRILHIVANKKMTYSCIGIK